MTVRSALKVGTADQLVVACHSGTNLEMVEDTSVVTHSVR